MSAPTRRTPLRLRLLAVLVAAVLLVGLVVASSRERTDQPPGPTTPATAPDDAATDDAATGDGTAGDAAAAPDVSVLASPDLAAAAGGPAVLAAAAEAARVQWADLVDPAWRGRLPDLPAYVGEVAVDVAARRVDADVVVALDRLAPGGGDDAVVLRFLPGADALRAGDATVAATVDGTAVDAVVDPAGALLHVPLPPGTGEAPLLRLRFGYHVPTLAEVLDDGGPAGFGLLAAGPGMLGLGHWLPLLSFDPDPMVAWGDVGAFPPALFSVRVTSAAEVVGGGHEQPCPDVPADCTWARGVALRDLALWAYRDPVVATAGEVRVVGPAGTDPARAAAMAGEAADAAALFARRLGPLPWTGLDVALAPLRAAAGMEFPGLVVVDPEYLGRLDGGFGTFVTVHEVAHQWFHALVGSSSLDDAVVDESLAQYLSAWYYDEVLGPAAAADLVERHLVGRYEQAVAAGLAGIAPAAPLAAFGDADAYGPLVYARGPLAWTAAEAEVGRDAVAAFLAELVDERGLGTVTAGEVRDLAALRLPPLAAAIERWWFDPAALDPRG